MVAPLIVAGALGALGSVAGGLIGSSGARANNRTQIQLAREQMDFQERMSNTAVQRAMQDYEKAGFNPMLAMTNPASAPSGSLANTENASAPLANAVSNASQSAMAMAAGKAQIENIKAQTATQLATADKTRAEATMVQAQTPYSASNAYAQSEALVMQARKLGLEANSILADINTKSITQSQLEKLNPLIQEWQRLQNQAAKAGIPEKQALAKFYENVPAAKWLAIIRSIFK